MDENIAAVSTPPGRGGIGIVRVCGKGALEIAATFFRPLNIRIKPRQMKHGFIYDGNLPIDEALLCYMKAPHSYTAMDTVEINCHGGYAVVQKVLGLALKAGARLAQPGEFTKLAFLNGRIDLTQAEAVMGIINAESDYALASAAKQLSGALGGKVSALLEALTGIQALLAVSIDYPDEYSADMGDVSQRVSYVLGELDRMIASAGLGRVLTSGVKTTIAGRPNTGKSSLLNAMLEQERAIVTDIPGTTRDLLSERLYAGPLALNLTDTAGIRPSGDVIEQMGVERSVSSIKGADLAIWVLDASCPLTDGDFGVWEIVKDCPRAICAMNKTDLPSVLGKAEIEARFGVPAFPVSAKYSQGVESIKEHIIEMFSADGVQPGDLITAERHRQAFERAQFFLKNTLDAVEAGLTDDLIWLDLQEAAAALGEIIGRDAGADLIDTIFSSFCVGK